jgi:hypothetical protein
MVNRFDRIIPPGGWGNVTLSFDSTGYSGMVRERAMVVTNDPMHDAFEIMMEMKVQPILDARPYMRFIAFTKKGNPKTEKLLLENKLDKPVLVVGMSHDLNDQAVVKLKTLKPGWRYELSLSTLAREKDILEGDIKLQLKDAPVDKVIVPVYVEVH